MASRLGWVYLLWLGGAWASCTPFEGDGSGTTSSTGTGATGGAGQGGDSSGGKGGGGALPTLEAIHVRDVLGAPVSGVSIAVGDATGAVSVDDSKRTDATGDVMLEVPAGASVNAFDAGDAGQTWVQSAFGLEDGGELTFIVPRKVVTNNPIQGYFNTSCTGTVTAGMSCNPNASIGCSTGVIYGYDGCPGDTVFDAIFVERSGVDITRYGFVLEAAFAADVSLGTVSLDKTLIANASFLTTEVTGVSLISQEVLGSRGGRPLFEIVTPYNDPLSSHSEAVEFPVEPFDTYRLLTSASFPTHSRGIVRVVPVAALPASMTLSATALVPPTDAEIVLGTTSTLTVTAASTPADALVLRIGQAPGIAGNGVADRTWTVILPASATGTYVLPNIAGLSTALALRDEPTIIRAQAVDIDAITSYGALLVRGVRSTIGDRKLDTVLGASDAYTSTGRTFEQL